MSNETSKTKKIWSQKEIDYLKGDGIDIGCGNDPVFSHVIPFDKEHGDANQISKYFPNKKLDFVFSSHCLEHMIQPENALKEWFSILKPGGYLFVIVPDEDLYEQGHFPSKYNDDHKWTFTISKRKSWSNKSKNILELAHMLTENNSGQLVQVELQDMNFDYKIHKFNKGWFSHRLWRWFKKVSRPFKDTSIETYLSRFYSCLGSSFDQTFMGGDRLAQIQFIIRKN